MFDASTDCPASVSPTHSPDPDPDGNCQWCTGPYPRPARGGAYGDDELDLFIAARFRRERRQGARP